jgi:hypothetical protein
MTTSSQLLPGELPAFAAESDTQSGLLAKVLHRFATWRCEFHGHAPYLCFERDRLYLYCSECQLASPGWRLEAPAPQLRHPGAEDRFARYSWLAASAALQSRVATGELVLY